jgi:hypothetical protein
MTKKRFVSGETPFGAWLRENPKLDAQSEGLYVTDLDYTLFRFKPGVLFMLEVKTRGGQVGRHQNELLSILDQACRSVDGNVFDTLRGRRKLRFCGVYRLILSGTTPEDSEWMKFGRIGSESYLITVPELEMMMNGGPEGLTPDNWIAIQEKEALEIWKRFDDDWEARRSA